MSTRTRIGNLALASAAIAVVVIGLAAGCDRGGTKNAGGSTMEAYLSCLQQHGVDLPQMGASGGPGNDRRSPGARPSGSFPAGARPSGARPSGSFPAGARASDGAGPGGPGGWFGPGDQAPAGVDQATWEKAQKACSSLRPSGRPQMSGRPQGGADNGANAAYQNCLKDHGVTASASAKLDSTDPTVAAAIQACAPLRPTGGSARSVQPTPTPSG